MSIVPVLIDSRLPYLGGNSRGGSLLLLSMPQGRLLDEIASAVAAVTPLPLIIAPTFEPYAQYERELRSCTSRIERVCATRDLWQHLERLEVSDALLFVSPACYPADGFDFTAFCGSPLDRRTTVKHLLAFEASTGTRELVDMGHDGRVRRIQRYFDPVNWPFASAVAASLVPASFLRLMGDYTLGSLEELRGLTAPRGIPSQDVSLSSACYQLANEAGALALCSRRLLGAAPLGAAAGAARRGTIHRQGIRAATASIADSARIVGPVAIAAGSRIEAGALIIGPSVIGAGAVVGRGAVVAQSLVVAGAVVPDGAVVRHRVADSDLSRRVNDHRRHDVPDMSAAIPGQTRPNWRLRYIAAKAVLEPIVAGAALLTLAPLMLLLAILVGATSPGPIFFGDVREGKDGRTFYCWKFRSMRVHANDMQRTLKAQQKMDGPQFKMDRDPRVTAVGRWLRRLNLDELPQLWNVARGEMSFVGPRPSPFRENQICVPWRNGRLSVRPGITGLWQVCRHDRALGDFHQWIYYDLLYVRNVSPLLDLKIFIGTVLTLGGKWPLSLSTMLGAPVPRVEVPTDAGATATVRLPSATYGASAQSR